MWASTIGVWAAIAGDNKRWRLSNQSKKESPAEGGLDGVPTWTLTASSGGAGLLIAFAERQLDQAVLE
jgi:hypothetical protein